MQKKLIALAIAGLASAPVFAQTNVTVYGVVDVTVESVKASGGDAFEVDRRTRVTSNSSLIGFRGTEDLGNGLKALFQVESSFSADAGGGTLAGRDTFVGLEGGFGKVQLGKLTTIMRAAGAKVDFNPAATGIGFQAATYGTIGGVAQTGIDERINNAVMYTTPNFSGLTAQLAYSAGENRKSPDINDGEGINSQSYQLAAAYENGPLYVSAGYAVAQDPQAAASVLGVPVAGISDKLKDARIAAKYTFPSNTSCRLCTIVRSMKLRAPLATPKSSATRGWSVLSRSSAATRLCICSTLVRRNWTATHATSTLATTPSSRSGPWATPTL